jgi:hypothetical protein
MTDTISKAKLSHGKRSNGHKSDCSCHICENMIKKAQRGGYEEDAEKEKIKKMGGPKKKNGHKPDCDCPICKNMKQSSKKVDDEESDSDEEEKKTPSVIGRKKGNGHKPTCGCPICKNMKKSSKKGGDMEEQIKEKSSLETPALDSEYDSLETIGGRRRTMRRKRKGNGHKPTCACPICKNMKKTRRNKRRTLKHR